MARCPTTSPASPAWKSATYPTAASRCRPGCSQPTWAAPSNASLDFSGDSDSTAAMPTTPEFESILYKTDGPVATITLNRPEHLNTIVPPMPDEIEKAIGLPERAPAVKVIVLRGAGRAFSGGYDFGGGF